MSNSPVDILLVEDDPHDVELALRALRLDNPHLSVEVVRDGEEALDYMLRRGTWVGRAPELSPSLIILDLKLPKIGGLQVLEELKSNSESAMTPIVVLTSSGEHRDVSESYMLGANSYVQKPVNIGEFRSAIKAIANYWLGVSRLPSSRPRRIHTPLNVEARPDE